MSTNVAPYNPEWPHQFEEVARALARALSSIAGVGIEHVGSTAVPGLAAKPILDIDVLVSPEQIDSAIKALEEAGYTHRGDLGLPGREAFSAPDSSPRRHVYLSTSRNVHVRNHLAVRDALRANPELRDEYAAVKAPLTATPGMTIDAYIESKSGVIQKILALSTLTTEERADIGRRNSLSTITLPSTNTNEASLQPLDGIPGWASRLLFRPMTPVAAQEIADTWTYPEPFDFYNATADPDDYKEFVTPAAWPAFFGWSSTAKNWSGSSALTRPTTPRSGR